ncbi:HAD family hydrolase [uncultured Veillonella sp.]|uniref:HAD family hydrolase n=1 Tax=uncultured Veillonella sp. TaxID=159268 RepID=UPI00260068F8|nr:HAD hydrolase-like protein [uncultured Veillonella sp.]
MNILCWDVDGTLIDTGIAGRAALDSVFDKRIGMERPALTMTNGGRTDRYVAWQFYIAAHKAAPTEAQLNDFISAYEDELCQALKRYNRQVLPNVKDILEAVSASNQWENRLFTGNRERGAKKKLNLYGLDGYFNWSQSVLADNYVTKLEVAKAIKGKLGLSYADYIEKIIFIGDTMADINFANSVGVKSIAVATGACSKNALEKAIPTILLDSLPPADEFLHLINSL